MKKQTVMESIKDLEEQNRNSISPNWAKTIVKSFDCKLENSLIRTGVGYREWVKDENKPRVTVSSLAESICKQLNIEPDEQLNKLANQMCGEGSYHELITLSCCKALRKHFKLKMIKYR